MNIIEQNKARKAAEEAAKVSGTNAPASTTAAATTGNALPEAGKTPVAGPGPALPIETAKVPFGAVSPQEAPQSRTEADLNRLAANSVATGMQSSADSTVPHPTNVSFGTLGQSAPVSRIDRDLVPSGAYIALNLNQFTLPNGKTIRPVGGFYDISVLDEEDQEPAAKELAHFAKQYGLVEKKD